ncbi:DUF1853 family protein [Pseudoduganella ginsengisoli]|uniref:DUF1853 family protein n=1 Tax=Pseudoduganella ginsengisoli TaxID=1462440 RepID=A0A6L6Q1E2_9BURK|nr:DUF1853 family protein [Pseudoduganella ginsengisoli]MTW03455.1 DUF1853 family protein [Pseudoduganella ginsengisoli]
MTYQQAFEQRWRHLTRPHVRALAWLLESPDLLDPASSHWQGRVATLGPMTPAAADWLAALEHDPSTLDAALGAKFYSRLGLYAEKLMAFYLAWQGVLAAHGLQVRAHRNETVGEFDFLLREGARLLHWEFASKFYLLDDQVPASGRESFHHLVGPNLADTLGKKIRKTFSHQLELRNHPAAARVLPQPVDEAQALVKGWLFHPPGPERQLEGVSPGHCRGYWMTLADFLAGPAQDGGKRYVVMPRMQWLAPLKVRMATPEEAPFQPASIAAVDKAAPLTAAGLHAAVLERFALEMSPVMAATVEEQDGWLVEVERGFIAPDDWHERAAARRAQGALP